MRALSIRSLATRAALKDSIDFFGIKHVTNKDLAAAHDNKGSLTTDELQKKYETLIVTAKPTYQDKEVLFNFGAVRFDLDNKTDRHGQYEEAREIPTTAVKQLFVPDGSKAVQPEPDKKPSETRQLHPGEQPEVRIVDIKAVEDFNNILSLFKTDQNPAEILKRYANTGPACYFFESDVTQFERHDISSQITKTGFSAKAQSSGSMKKGLSHDGPVNAVDVNPDLQEDPDVRRPQLIYDALNLTIDPEDNIPSDTEEEYSDRYAENKFDKAIEHQVDVPLKKTPPKKAIDHIRSIREKVVETKIKPLSKKMTEPHRFYPIEPSLKLDSMGKRDYTFQVPDWRKVRPQEALEFLRGCIIYHEDDILAINKPYGLASHNDAKGQDTYDINSLLSQLVKTDFGLDKVYLTHRLDKTTTGVLIFATSKVKASFMNKSMKSGDVKKTYLAITRGIPEPDAGIINIPIGSMNVMGKERMCLAPVSLPKERQIANRYQEARLAVTEYKTLNVARGNLSLVEVKPQTGVKHQIRCHLGFGLGTPILGDHKYTDIGRLVPQKLPPGALKALNVRQERVRTLPIHLHASRIVIPHEKSRSIFIDAPLPPHFVENMKSLKLTRSSK